jgi:Protein kinase domain
MKAHTFNSSSLENKEKASEDLKKQRLYTNIISCNTTSSILDINEKIKSTVLEIQRRAQFMICELIDDHLIFVYIDSLSILLRQRELKAYEENVLRKVAKKLKDTDWKRFSEVINSISQCLRWNIVYEPHLISQVYVYPQPFYERIEEFSFEDGVGSLKTSLHYASFLYKNDKIDCIAKKFTSNHGVVEETKVIEKNIYEYIKEKLGSPVWCLQFYFSSFERTQNNESELILFIEQCDGTLEDTIPDFYSFFTENELKESIKLLINGFKCLEKIGISHSDIKPGNIFLKNKTLKIGDFNSSYLTFKENSNIRINKTIDDFTGGTIKYYSPELVYYLEKNLLGCEYSIAKSDVYSLGLTLLECLRLQIKGLDINELTRFFVNQDDKFQGIYEKIVKKQLGKLNDQDIQYVKEKISLSEAKTFDAIDCSDVYPWLKNIVKDAVLIGQRPRFKHLYKYHFDSD